MLNKLFSKSSSNNIKSIDDIFTSLKFTRIKKRKFEKLVLFLVKISLLYLLIFQSLKMELCKIKFLFQDNYKKKEKLMRKKNKYLQIKVLCLCAYVCDEQN